MCLEEFLSSKKAKMTLIVLFLIVFGKYLNLNPEDISTLKQILLGYLMAQGATDAFEKLPRPTPNPEKQSSSGTGEGLQGKV